MCYDSESEPEPSSNQHAALYKKVLTSRVRGASGGGRDRLAIRALGPVASVSRPLDFMYGRIKAGCNPAAYVRTLRRPSR
jgi:hypothetical protein